MESSEDGNADDSEVEVSAQIGNYLELPTSKLLDQFGAGDHIPGSGAAAALSGLLACKLLITVIQITLQKKKYSDVHRELEYMGDKIEKEYYPKLRKLFKDDCREFDKVMDARKKRDSANNDKNRRKWQRKERELLKNATEIPVGIGKNCLQVAEYAINVFDSGYKAVRGDSGAAGSIAIAGASTAVFVAYLNLQRFRGSDWAQDMEEKTADLRDSLQDKQANLFSRVADLRDEDVDAVQQQIFDLDIFDSGEEA